jgi:nickel/cobalt transporter (NicO) family protein
MKRWPFWLLAPISAAIVMALAPMADAHPAGFTSINRYVGVSSDARGVVHIAYLLDFAELPAYAEIEQLDADHDGTVTPAEQAAYLERRLGPIVDAWTVEVDGRRAKLRVTGSNLEVLPGERGLSTLRLAADVVAEGAEPIRQQADNSVRTTEDSAADRSGTDRAVHVVDPVFAERSGWREMAAEESPDATVVSGPTARAADILAYAKPSPDGPPRVDDAKFVFRPRTVPAPMASADRPPAPVVVDPRLAALSSAMQKAEGSPAFTFLAIGLALVLGAAHALSPGHGKSLAAAYLVGRRARPSHALLFGAAVTTAHTAVVFAIGCVAIAIERTMGSDRVLRGLELVSAVTVVGLGIVQLSRRWREAASMSGGHDHEHVAPEAADGLRSLLLLGTSSGLTPCPAALALLLSAVALHRYGLGLVLVLAFSLGVATTLTAAGLLVVLARSAIERAVGDAPVLRWLPVMSSMCVLVIGILLCASAWSSPALR